MLRQAKFGLRFPRWASGLSESAKDLLRNLLGAYLHAELALWLGGLQTCCCLRLQM